MPTKNDCITDEIHELGLQLGFDSLAFDSRGSLQLAIENTGILGFERQDQAVLIYLMRYVGHPDKELLQRALEICHYDHTSLDWCQASLIRDHQLTFATKLSRSEFRVATIESSLDKLSELHDQVMKSV
ncbi:CesT family type III secretion system chaperone [Bremerella sp. JC770]|uniref:CesT family type III secretion system chaperone n=1 Tax=Bremerella sp. JC770 TaxID=3232137 RepID=UPI003459DC2E